MRLNYFLLFLLISNALHAQFALSDTVNLAQERIMDLRFEEARTLISRLEKTEPKNGMIPYLKSNMLFLEVFTSNDAKLYETYIDSISVLIEQVAENEADTTLLYNFALTEMHIEVGTIHMLFNNNWKSAWAILDAFSYIKANRNAPESFLPQQLANGVLNVALGSMPSKYKWFTNLLGYTGDVQTGLEQLKKATLMTETPYAAFAKKSAFVYSYISFFLKADEDFNVSDIYPNYYESPLLVFAQAKILHERSQNDALISLLKGRKKSGRIPFYMLDFMLGKAMLNKFDPDADAIFLTFLNRYPGENNIKATYRYLSWHYYLRGNSSMAEKYKGLALTKGAANNGADKLAIVDAKRKVNVYLLRAQLSYDGGYYQKALNALAEGAQSYINADDRIQYHYRLGRIYQQTNDITAAIQAYKNLLQYEESANTYEAGNAALQLGLMYEILEKPDLAASYFRAALAQSDFPFDDGIHQKAKAGLSRLKVKS